MRVFIVLSLFVAASSASSILKRQADSNQDRGNDLSGFDFTGALVQTFGQFTRQLSGAQRILGDLSSQFNRMIESGTRLVGGQNAEGGDNRAGGGSPIDALLEPLRVLTNQLGTLQKSLTDISSQFTRLVSSGTRIINGKLDADEGERANEGNTNYGESILAAVSQWTRQLEGMQKLLGEINQSFNRVVSSGTRMVGKAEAENEIPNIGKTLLDNFNSWTRQLSGMQRTLLDINNQVNRMIQSGSRMITGKLESEDENRGMEFGQVDIAKTLIDNFGTFTKQLASMQRALGEINGHLTRMITTGSRMIAGSKSEEKKF